MTEHSDKINNSLTFYPHVWVVVSDNDFAEKSIRGHWANFGRPAKKGGKDVEIAAPEDLLNLRLRTGQIRFIRPDQLDAALEELESHNVTYVHTVLGDLADNSLGLVQEQLAKDRKFHVTSAEWRENPLSVVQSMANPEHEISQYLSGVLNGQESTFALAGDVPPEYMEGYKDALAEWAKGARQNDRPLFDQLYPFKAYAAQARKSGASGLFVDLATAVDEATMRRAKTPELGGTIRRALEGEHKQGKREIE